MTTTRHTTHHTPLGKEITIERLARLLGEKAIQRLEIAALREEALTIIPVTPDDLDRAARFIEGRTPKGIGKNAARPRQADRYIFARSAMKYLMEKPQARTHFITWCRTTAADARKEGKRGKA